MSSSKRLESDLYRYLNTLSFQNLFNEYFSQNTSIEFPHHGLPSFDNSKLKSHFLQKPKGRFSRVFCCYHYESNKIIIESIGISDKNKVAKFSSKYIDFILANIARCMNIADDNDTILLFVDESTNRQVINFLRNSGHSRVNQVLTVPILLNSDWARRPMWCRFRMVHYLQKFLSTLYDQDISLYCIDSDFIPSYKALDCEPSLHKVDMIFTSNKDSFNYWPINEGMFCIKNTYQASIFIDYVLFIYFNLVHDKYVLQYWKDPRVWRGAQAALLLSCFSFMQNMYTKNINQVKYIKSIQLGQFSFNSCILNATKYNSPPTSEDFINQKWGVHHSSCYHFTGNHKANTLVDKFLNYCKNEITN